MVMVSREHAMPKAEYGKGAREGTPGRAQASGTDTAAPDTSDEQLMRSFCSGEEAGFEALFLRYKQTVFGFFCRRVTDRARAEELTQECFLALLRSAERYRPEASFRTFSYAVALNLLRADRRKSTFRALWSADPPEAEVADPHGDGAEAGLLLRDALGRLEAPDREVLMLRTYEEMSYAEIAELLQMPVGTVRSRLFRARAALRDLLTSRQPAPHTRSASLSTGTMQKSCWSASCCGSPKKVLPSPSFFCCWEYRSCSYGDGIAERGYGGKHPHSM